jgi:uncharacterized protein (DUF433 family)
VDEIALRLLRLDAGPLLAYPERKECIMASLDHVTNANSDIDWTGCELVERIPGKVSGRPLVRGTRILADTIVQDAELGSPLEEIHENYPDLPLTAIQRLVSFAHSRPGQYVP